MNRNYELTSSADLAPLPGCEMIQLTGTGECSYPSGSLGGAPTSRQSQGHRSRRAKPSHKLRLLATNSLFSCRTLRHTICNIPWCVLARFVQAGLVLCRLLVLGQHKQESSCAVSWGGDTFSPPHAASVFEKTRTRCRWSLGASYLYGS